MKRTLVCLVALLFAAGASHAQVVELTLHPSIPSESAKKLRLLPEAEKRTNADAVPLYIKAAQSLPKNLNTNQIRQWLRTPPGELPRNEIQSILQQLKPVLQSVDQAVGCKLCNWPAVAAGTMPAYLSEYRSLAYILALKARLEIAQASYNQAANTIGTGLAAAKHIGESPIITQGLVGAAIAGLILKQLDEFVQAPAAPNLHEALGRLPKPLVDLNKPIAAEIANLKSNLRYILVRKRMEQQLKPAHDRVRLIMNRLDRQVAALQCIEALRFYAGANQGNFPDALADIAQVPLPNDPVTQKPFVYSRTGSEAVLKGPAPKGADAKEAIEYRLTLKK